MIQYDNGAETGVPTHRRKTSIDGSRDYLVINPEHPEIKALYDRLAVENATAGVEVVQSGCQALGQGTVERLITRP